MTEKQKKKNILWYSYSEHFMNIFSMKMKIFHLKYDRLSDKEEKEEPISQIPPLTGTGTITNLCETAIWFDWLSVGVESSGSTVFPAEEKTSKPFV